MKTALFALPRGMDFAHAVPYCKELGVDGLEPGNCAELASPDVKAAARIREDCAAAGIAIPSLAVGIDLSRPGDEGKRSLDTLMAYADVAAALGAPVMLHTLSPNFNPRFPEKDPEGAFLRLSERSREVFDYAKSLGVLCAYEEQGLLINGVANITRFLAMLDRPAGIVLDSGNAVYADELPEDIMRAFRDRIVHVHIKDYLLKPASSFDPGEGWEPSPAGQYIRGTVIGHGDLALPTIIRELVKTGYDGYYSMEFEGFEDPFYANRVGLTNMRRMEEEALHG